MHYSHGLEGSSQTVEALTSSLVCNRL